MTTESPEVWLAQQFEFEYCAECGGDAEHHTVCAGPFGNYFARCEYPPSDETGWDYHPVITKFHQRNGRW